VGRTRYIRNHWAVKGRIVIASISETQKFRILKATIRLLVAARFPLCVRSQLRIIPLALFELYLSVTAPCPDCDGQHLLPHRTPPPVTAITDFVFIPCAAHRSANCKKLPEPMNAWNCRCTETAIVCLLSDSLAMWRHDWVASHHIFHFACLILAPGVRFSTRVGFGWARRLMFKRQSFDGY
jgi:hypothetical protein